MLSLRYALGLFGAYFFVFYMYYRFYFRSRIYLCSWPSIPTWIITSKSFPICVIGLTSAWA